MKKAISALVCVALIITMFPASVMAESTNSTEGWDGSIATEFAGGDGTESEPYQISNEAELAVLAKMVNEGDSCLGCYFVLMEDLNLFGNEWQPIGNKETPFEGHFDGMKHSIRNLIINSNEDYVGLFGVIGRSGGLSSINLDNSRVSGKQYVGIVAGSNNGGIANCIISDSEVDGMTQVGGVTGDTAMNVSNCIVQGTKIRGNGNYVGGIIGYADLRGHNYTIESCGVKASSIDGENSVGGVIGYKDQGDSSVGRFGIDIIGCYNIGSSVTGIENVGGILGDAYNWYTGDFLNVSECCNSGTIIGDNSVGGIVGNQIGKFNNGYFDLENCFNIGDITATDNYAAGICGATAKNIRNCHNVGSVSSGNVAANICAATSVTTLGDTYYATVENCYYLNGTDKYATKLSPDEMKDKNAFTGWDFENTWRLNNGKYPELKYLPEEKPSEEETWTEGDFNYYRYRAYTLTNGTPTAKKVESVINEDTPTDEIIPLLQKNGAENMMALLQSIEIIFNTVEDVGNIYDYKVGGKELYQTIIFETIRRKNDCEFLEVEKEISSDFDDLFTALQKGFSAKYGIELSDTINFAELSNDRKDFINKFIENFYASKFPELSSVGKVFEHTENFFEAQTSVQDYLNNLNGNIALIQMTESEKRVIKELYTVCPSESHDLKEALRECVEIMNKTSDEYINLIIENTIKAAGKLSVHYFTEKLWEKVMDRVYLNSPLLAALMAGYKGGNFVSNAVFRTDEYKGKYFEVLAINDVEHLLDVTRKSMRNKYLQEKTTENAADFLSSLDFSYDFRDNDCIKAYDLADIQENSFANLISSLWNPEQFKDAKEFFSNWQKRYFETKEESLTCWVNSLDKDFPNTGLYQKYQHLFEESIDQIISKKFIIACPVNLRIYDSTGTLIGKVVNDIPWVKSGVALGIGVDHDEKTIFFSEGIDYQIEYEGTDIGKMEIKISEYSNEKCVRNVKFYDIELKNGLKYSQIVKSGNNDVYSLSKDSIQNSIEPDVDSKQENNVHNIKLQFGFFSDSNVASEMKASYRENIEIKAFIPEGYKFVKWNSNRGDNIFKNVKQEITTFEMPNNDVSIFAEIIRTTADDNISTITGKSNITVSCGNGGSISPSESVKVNYGKNQTFTITPDDGYEIEDVLVDGKSIGAVDTYTFERVTQNHKISATFKKKAAVDDNDVQSALSKKIKAAKSVKIKAWSSVGRNKNGKRYIKVQWSKKGAAVTGYQVYRSYKRTSGYKKFFTTKNRYYFNTKQLKKGQRHYYKVRAYTKINGKNYYSKWSNLAYRKLK